jgi:hypothetical protein
MIDDQTKIERLILDKNAKVLLNLLSVGSVRNTCSDAVGKTVLLIRVILLIFF